MSANYFILNFARVKVRLDTYLWAIRLYKSRTLASTSIKAGKVKLNDSALKPSHYSAVGEVYTINLGSGNKKIVEVVTVIDKRQAYEAVKDSYIDHTPPAEKTEKLEDMFFKVNIQQERGSGRPTKKNRRDLGTQGGWF